MGRSLRIRPLEGSSVRTQPFHFGRNLIVGHLKTAFGEVFLECAHRAHFRQLDSNEFLEVVSGFQDRASLDTKSNSGALATYQLPFFQTSIVTLKIMAHSFPADGTSEPVPQWGHKANLHIGMISAHCLECKHRLRVMPQTPERGPRAFVRKVRVQAVPWHGPDQEKKHSASSEGTFVLRWGGNGCLVEREGWLAPQQALPSKNLVTVG